MKANQKTTLPNLSLQLDGHGAMAEQLARALKRAILDGLVPSGSALPATRALASLLKVSRVTAVAAYELLAAEQLVTARQGSATRVVGTYPARLPPPPGPTGEAPSRFAARARKLGPLHIAAFAQPSRLELHYRGPALQAPLYRAWRRRLAAAALQVEPGYPKSKGYLPLREALCDYLARRRGVLTHPDRVFIVGGTQQALTLLARVLLDEGDGAVLEEPWYELAWRVFTAHGARLLAMPTDAEGLIVDKLPERGPKLALVTPSHQFPSGSVMSMQRRLALLDWARRARAWIIEDDYDSEFRYGGADPQALRSLDRNDRVIYVGTFSKTLFPAMRLGYVVCPDALCDDLANAKLHDDLGCASIEQAALATFIRHGQYERHLARMVRELTANRNVLLQELRAQLANEVAVSDSTAGMHLVLWFTRLDYRGFDRLLVSARQAGLGLYPIHPFYKTRPRRPGLLVGFAGLSVPELREAVTLLARCLHDLTPT